MAIALELPGSIKSLNPVPIDWAYGPFTTVAAAKAAIPLGLRYDGLTVQITGSGNFWWLGADLTDPGLVVKGGGITNSAGNTELPMSQGVGTNLIGSSIFSSAPGNLDLGIGLAGTIRNVNAQGSATNVDLQFTSKGLGSLILVGNAVVIGATTYGTTIGDVTIQGNQSSVANTQGGSVRIYSGQGNTGNANSGNIFIETAGKIGSGIVGSVAFFKTTPSFGGGEKVVFFGRATTIPATNPVGGGLFFVKTDDKPYWRDSAGVETSMLGGAGWALSGTSILSGGAPIIIDETTTTTNVLKFRTPGLGVTSVDGKGIWIYNDSVAVLNNQQISGSLVLEGSGFATTPVAPQSVKWRIDNLPVQGTANPSTQLRLASSVNGGAYTIQAYFSSDGSLTFPNSASGIQFAAGNGLIQTGGGGNMRLGAAGSGGGVILEAAATSVNGTAVVTIGGAAMTQTTGSTQMILFRSTNIFAPTSGGATYSGILFNHVLNTTGSYSGIGYGIDYDPTLTSVTGLTHIAIRATSGKILLGGTTITAGSVLMDLQSTTLALLLTRVTNIASVTTPVNGMVTYDAATNLFNFRQNGSWVTLGGISFPLTSSQLTINNPAATFKYTITSAAIVADRTITLPLLTANDTLVTEAFTQTLSNKTLTAPKFVDTGFIADNNGNAQITFNTVASAVNGLSVFNAATGGTPALGVSGTDSNISLSINTKGTGILNIYGNSMNIGGAGYASGSVGPISIIGNNSNGSGQAGSNIILKTGSGVTGNANSGNIYLDNDVKAGSGTVGNIGLFTTTYATWNTGEKIVYMGVATTPPNATGATSGIFLWAETITGTTELRVQDSAGNKTTLSPHNFLLIPNGASEKAAWSYLGEYNKGNGRIGRVNVDILAVIREVERLTGKKLVFEDEI